MGINEKIGFTSIEMAELQDYFDKYGDSIIPLGSAELLYIQYMKGLSFKEINEMYSEYSLIKIKYTAYKFNWPEQRDNYYQNLQININKEIETATVQQFSLIKTMLGVAYQEHMPAFLLYLKNPQERNLPKGLRIKSIQDLKIMSSMMKELTDNFNLVNPFAKTEVLESTPLELPKVTTSNTLDLLNRVNKNKERNLV